MRGPSAVHNAGAVLAFSSDWTVAEMDPMQHLYTAVTRRGRDGGEPWAPEQALPLADAVYAYTMGSAWANFCEQNRGSITPGKYADRPYRTPVRHRARGHPRGHRRPHHRRRKDCPRGTFEIGADRPRAEPTAWPVRLVGR